MDTNLKPARRAAGLTQEEAAQKTGIALGTLRRWEQGINEPDISSIILLANLYGVTTDTLIGSKFADDLDGFIKADGSTEFVEVPLYGAIAAGVPIEMIKADDRFPIPTDIVDVYPDAFLLKVKGESMNKRIPNGSYALVDPSQKDIIDNKPYALCINGFDATIKRIHKLNNGLELIPDSSDPTFEKRTFNFNEPTTEEIMVIGRVVWITMPFNYEI